ncbi:hypothetical protein ABW21_db0201508 [Orbilia brochopaga]|nr:hypothetical protein ABW21_db0201508 [Drechslerella brochopaga]
MGTVPISRVPVYNSGLWILPSFLRHSCIPNAHRAIIGDMAIVRAGCDMPKDTKVTVNCTTASVWEYPMTKFACTCPVHEYEATDGDKPGASEERRNRQILWDDFNADCARIEACRAKPEGWGQLGLLTLLPLMINKLVAIEKTMPPVKEIPHIQLAHRYRYIAAIQYGSGQRRHATCAYYKVLDSLGADYCVLGSLDKLVIKNPGQCCEDLLHTYRDLAGLATTPGIKKGWRNAAIDVYEILYGERVSYDTVVHTIEFRQCKDQCDCLGADNFLCGSPMEMMKRLKIDPATEKEWLATPEATAMQELTTAAARRAWTKIAAAHAEDLRRKKTVEEILPADDDGTKKTGRKQPEGKRQKEVEGANKENEG